MDSLYSVADLTENRRKKVSSGEEDFSVIYLKTSYYQKSYSCDHSSKTRLKFWELITRS